MKYSIELRETKIEMHATLTTAAAAAATAAATAIAEPMLPSKAILSNLQNGYASYWLASPSEHSNKRKNIY